MKLKKSIGRQINLRTRLALLYGGITALLLVTLGGGLYYTLRRIVLADQADLVTANARAVASDLDWEDGQLHWHVPDGGWPDGLVVALYDREGRLVGRNQTSASLEPFSEALPESIRRQLSQMNTAAPLSGRGSALPEVREVVRDQGEWTLVTLALVQEGSPGAAPPEQFLGYLQVARSLETVEATLRRLLVLLLASIPLTILGAGVGGYFLAGRALRPVDAMIDAAERIDRQNLSQRLPEPRTADEVARLARTFNRLLERLEEGFRRERQFTADASHELRTPTAVILAQAQAARARRRSPEEYEQTLDTIAAEARHMSRLLDQLLFLARSDAGVDPLDREELDLAEIARSVVDQMQESAAERGVQITFARPREAGPEGTTLVTGDQTRLMQIFLNLLDNALRYCPPGSHVTVGVHLGDGWVVAEVEDDGPGIPPEHLDRLFERFYRVDRSRTRQRPGGGNDAGTQGSGAGLGLAIVRSIVQAHGGRIEVMSRTKAGEAQAAAGVDAFPQTRERPPIHSTHGTLFRIILPAAARGREASSPAARPGQQGPG